MGWNQQNGDRWVLQRSVMHTDGEHDPAPALIVRINGLLTIRDAERLGNALLEEAQAARKSMGTDFASAVLKMWDIELQPWQEKIVKAAMTTEVVAGTSYECRKCGGLIFPNQYRFGSPETGWEHTEGECIVKDERIDYGPQFDEG